MNREFERTIIADSKHFYPPRLARRKVESLLPHEAIVGMVTIKENGHPHFYMTDIPSHTFASQAILAHKDDFPDFDHALGVVINRDNDVTTSIVFSYYYLQNSTLMRGDDKLLRNLSHETYAMQIKIIKSVLRTIPVRQRSLTPIEILNDGLPETTIYNPQTKQLIYP